MATITRKPHPPLSDDPHREAAIVAVINKGLTHAEAPAQEPADPVRQVVLFMPASLLGEVDVLVQQVRPRTSRRAWLVEAIREKVERDQKSA